MSIKSLGLISAMIFALSACALTPEQQAMREAKRVKAAQDLHVKLAKQCDVETAELIQAHYHPPIEARSKKEQAEFEKRYTEKVNNPVFQACYKLALENHKAQEEIEYMRRYYYDDYRFFHRGWFCHSLC